MKASVENSVKLENLNHIKELLSQCQTPKPNPEIAERWNSLTKPMGSLGEMENIVAHLGRWQQTARPKADNIHILLFAGNHGIAKETSMFPPEVTIEMVKNFNNQGAVINQLAQFAEAKIRVELMENGNPTNDFTQAPAMTESQCLAAFNKGFESVSETHHLVCLGEMGIGNTASAAALAAALTDQDAANWTGKGSGVSGQKYQRKLAVVQAGLNKQCTTKEPLELLCRLGGFEIAALVGVIVAARIKKIPIMLDGFITTVAALLVAKVGKESSLAHCLSGHCSAEQAHKKMLAILGIKPILELGMRLGEGSGAVTAALIVKAALKVYNQTSTFEEAAVKNAIT